MEENLIAIGALCIKMKHCSSWWQKQLLMKRIRRLYLMYTSSENTKNSRQWVRQIFGDKMRRLYGASDNLVSEMRLHDHEKYFNFLRMSPEMFDKLLAIVGPSIAKQQVVRDHITASTRLEITLRYLASGDSMISLSYLFRVGHSTVSKIISETCDAIWNNLKNIVFIEFTNGNWLKIAEDFKTLWNFPNCIGCIDGKHIVIQAPPCAGSTYYNYKECHSIILLAIADAHSRFIMADIGAEGRQSDGGVFRNSTINEGIQKKLFNIPPPQPLAIHEDIVPFMLIGDAAFALTETMLRPYPCNSTLNRRKKVFNYRLSRARRMIESAFGILASRWRIYRKPIIASVSTVCKTIQASICLHNFIMKFNSDVKTKYAAVTEEELTQVAQYRGIINITRTGSNMYGRKAAQIRDIFADYFCNTGAVDWQWKKAMQNNF